ncbi:MAG TPA: DNRLRE domain-containing protein [Roseiflexaceae bacterium]|nr:DNRLRE domain-containing protein [Roseiflexaceae bacterium]
MHHTNTATTTRRIGTALGALLVTVLLFATTLSLWLPASTRAAASEVALAPNADTFVKSNEPDRSFGAAARINVDATPRIRSFLRFSVTGAGQNSVSRARLRLFVTDESVAAGIKVFRADTNWDELAVTWNTQPAMGQQVAELAPTAMKLNSWVEVDLGQAVTGDGVYSFALTSEATDRAGFSSRTRENAPQLVLTLGAAAPQPTAPLSATPVPTSAPTAVPPAPPATNPSGPALAFPGADGFGVQTPGGRGGRVIYVTTLADSGAGSLRAALEASGPRMVLFKVAGTITLQNDINITQPFVTIAGQTAPGEGVQIKSGMIRIRTHDVVIRYLKMRVGDQPSGSDPMDRDAIALSGTNGADVYNIVIDHCSLVWGPDIGGVSMLVNVHDVTVQNSIMGEGLYLSRHPEGTAEQSGHSMSSSIFQLDSATYGNSYPRRITMHHNLFTTSDHRNPAVIGGENVDIVNNVIYNWGQKAAHGNPRKLNLINNMFIRGPMTTGLTAWRPQLHSTTPSYFPASVFEQGNVTVGFNSVRGDPQSVYAPGRFSPYSITTEQSAQAAYDRLVQDVGANRPVRDSVDQRIVSNMIQRTGTFLNGVDLVWPNLASGPAPADADGDGMPDSWEQSQFGNTSRGSASDSRGDLDGDGYTDLEEYLNGTDPKAAGR